MDVKLNQTITSDSKISSKNVVNSDINKFSDFETESNVCVAEKSEVTEPSENRTVRELTLNIETKQNGFKRLRRTDSSMLRATPKLKSLIDGLAYIWDRCAK